jgi:hypothetical protein
MTLPLGVSRDAIRATYETAASADVFDVTLVTDTSAYASGDVLAVPQEIAGVFKAAGARRRLDSLVVLDEDDHGQALDLVFFNAAATLGTINAAVSISDTDARKIVGYVSVAQADYKDLVNSMLAVKSGLGQTLEGATTSLWVGAICRGGTPTYSAAGIKLKLGFA